MINPRESQEEKRQRTSADINDLPDNAHDQERLNSEGGVFDLPDVKDIPGQEHVKPAPMGEMADTTISSADEEGEGLFDDEDGADLFADDDANQEEDDNKGDDNNGVTNNPSGNDADVSPLEKELLANADQDMPGGDDERLRQAKMDNEDEDGEPLNQEGFGTDVSGSDLDVPGTESDDANENIGEEDEENNQYSRGASNNDNMTEGTP